MFSAFRKNTGTAEVLRKYFAIKNQTVSVEPLTELFHGLKREDFGAFVSFLKSEPEILENFRFYIKNLFKGKRFNLSLTEANILSENSFFSELKKRLLSQVLPPVEDENTVSYLIAEVLYTPKNDLKYFQQIDQRDFNEFFRIMELDDFVDNQKVKEELFFSLNILAWRVIGNALDVDVMKMAPEYKNFDNPFLALQNELDVMVADFRQDSNFKLNSKDTSYKQIKIYLVQCLDFVTLAFKNAKKYGISGKTNQSLLKIRQQLQRMSEILTLLVIDREEDLMVNSQTLVLNVIEYKSHRNNLTELVGDSTTLISHLITSHTAETGVNYITSSFKDYMKMFWKASGGGVIVGFLCILKMLYSYSPSSEFMHAVVYSFNYAMGFIMIFLMRYTLATKQPAMTAATMAKVLSEEKNTSRNYKDFAHLVSKLFRSQFIAFIGNVLWAFPVALAVIYGMDVLFQQNFAVEKSSKLLHDLDPFDSKALFHAGIAGFYLFISGVISGNVGNNSLFYQIPQRIAKTPYLTNLFGQRFARNLSIYYSKNWAGIISNFWFGVFLGATGPIGAFLGLDLDIRHITFAAGNFALGLYGKDFNVDNYTFFISFITVFLIGFMNFIVSFGLSMLLAFRSRKVEMGEVKEIYKEIGRYFLKNPMRFFLPIKSKLDQRARDLM